MRRYVILGCCGVLLLFAISGCTPLVLGGAATGGYMVGSDERTTGTIIDDSTITSRVKLRLVEDPLVKARQIDVDTLEKRVYLTGVVATRAEAGRAVAIARSVEGVSGVVDNMQVGAKTITQAMADKQLGVKIKVRLIGEPGVRSLNVDVDVDRGVVTLTGRMPSWEVKDRVIEIARTTAGTTKVVDNLLVSTDQ